MPEVIEDLLAVELAELEAAVGATSFKRGRSYARNGRVLSVEWLAEHELLTATVVGNGAIYQTAVSLVADGFGGLEFEEGRCSCPVSWNCKHVAAAVLAAGDRLAAAPRPQRPPAPKPWEAPLRELIDTRARRVFGDPLAVELTIEWTGRSDADPGRLLARLMRPGKRGGWINSSLRWDRLDPWSLPGGELRADHVALARELEALQRAGQQRSYYYHPGSDAKLDIGACDSRQLWPLLGEAARLGLDLLDGGSGRRPLAPPGTAELVVDVCDDGAGGSQVTPRLRGDGADVAPLLFLGASGHGVAGREPGAHADAQGRLALLRLERPVDAGLQRLLLGGASLAVPGEELDRFAREICPALARVAPVVSSDGSFEAPAVSAPSLVLRAAYGDDHLATVGWEWSYEVGDERLRTPLEPDSAAGYRDPDAERALLAGTMIPETGLEQFGLLDDAGRPRGGQPGLLAGLDSMRLATEVLPRLGEREGVILEVVGEVADYRDVGDALEIGVSTTSVEGERDWFDLGVSITVEGRELPFADVFAALAAGESRMLLDDGAHFALDEPRLLSLRQLIEEARGLADTPAGLRLSRYQAGLWDELVALGVVTEQAEAWQRQVDALARLETITEHELPETLNAELRPYQRDGFGWLATLWDLELGGILADDMGLGKTVQALAMILHARRADPACGTFLVVAPTSVVPNWVSETERFAPGLRTTAMTDTLARAGRTIDDVAGADVVVTTYTLLRLDAEDYRSVPWAGVILDEAQFVKNHQAKTYRAVRELQARVKLAMTGTPMENSLMELWSLLSITAPGLFPDPKGFGEHYARPIERRGDSEQLARLRRRIRPLVMRRTKEVVAADLPPKQEQTLTVELHPRHRRIYDTRLQRERQKILGLLDDFDRHRFTVLRSITLLRQLSLHPGLVDAKHEAVPCAKLSALVEQLQDVVGGGHRALVFSQFTGFLGRVRERLDAEGITYCYLDGSTRRRDRVLKQFREGEDPVFLISLKAGGAGLNLTEADYCFLLDPWWNPATEAQAIDRTHRIGQTRPVMVYRTIAADTIEEKVVALARRKAKLFSSVMDDGDLFGASLTAEDIRGLLG